MFEFDFSDKLRFKLEKLAKKDKKKLVIIDKKIKEIIQNDFESIERYKNLKYNFSEYKRVHIDKHFILIFKVIKENNLVIFADFDHHDKIY